MTYEDWEVTIAWAIITIAILLFWGGVYWQWIR